MADDIGEALDLVIGLAQIGGALVDGGLQVEIVVAQLRFGVVAGARGAPHQEDRDAGERDHQAGAGDRSRRGQRLAAVGGGGALREQPVLLGAHRARETRRSSHWHRWRRPRARIATPPAISLRLTKFDRRCANSSSRVSTAARSFLDIVGLDRIVAGQLARACRCREDARDGGLVIGQKFAARMSADSRARRFRRGGSAAAAALSGFRPRRCARPSALSSRAWLTRKTEAALIATSTKNPAASSRIWPIARRRVASGVTMISHHEQAEFNCPRRKCPQAA